MNSNNIGIYLISILAGIVNISIFIYLGSLILNFFKVPVQALQNGQNSGSQTFSPDAVRRKIKTKPTITCSLPILQEGRRQERLY